MMTEKIASHDVVIMEKIASHDVVMMEKIGNVVIMTEKIVSQRFQKNVHGVEVLRSAPRIIMKMAHVTSTVVLIMLIIVRYMRCQNFRNGGDDSCSS
jgi:hypothetical protein